MHSLFKVPLFFLCVAAGIGLLLRWHYYEPIEGLVFPYWLHAHSHLMFLGWLFNAISLGFVTCFIPVPAQKSYYRLLILLNILVLGMLFTFPLQGYGRYSIILSFSHTLAALGFGWQFFKDTRERTKDLPIRLARWAFVFFLVSSLAPVAIGVLSANGQGQSQLYYLAVYFFLHFQYNGAFTFGELALFYHLLTSKAIPIDEKSAQRFVTVLWITCVPAYVLSALWIQPGLVWNAVGVLIALAQLVGFWFFWRSIQRAWTDRANYFSRPTQVLLGVVLLSFLLKLVLQVLSAFPSVAVLAYEVRYFVIAYLHLVMLGFLSFLLLVWYQEYFRVRILTAFTTSILIGSFIFSELLMLLIPTGFAGDVLSLLLLVFSALLFLTFCRIAWLFARTSG